jgi:hypothetical protein
MNSALAVPAGFRVCICAGGLDFSNLEWRRWMRGRPGWSTTCQLREQQLTGEMHSAVRFRGGLGGAWMQTKLLEFFAQRKSG